MSADVLKLRTKFVLHSNDDMKDDRVEFGVTFGWHKTLKFWHNFTGKNIVQVFPPAEDRPEWFVYIPKTISDRKFVGDTAERDAFKEAALCVRNT